jgi:hypothetical protein
MEAMKMKRAKATAPVPEAPPVEPEVEPKPSRPAERPDREPSPSPFDPDWPDDLPLPQPKARTTIVCLPTSEVTRDGQVPEM